MKKSSIPAAAAVAHIEQLAKTYRTSLDTLKQRVDAMNAETQAINDRHMPNIRLAIATALDAQAKVITAVNAQPQLFVKPRSMTLCGIKLGFAKGRGKTIWPKAEELIAKLRRTFAPKTCETLIVKTEAPNKDAIKMLPAQELKKLGISIVDTTDAAFAEPAETTVDKQVAELIENAVAEFAAKQAAAA